MVCRRFLYNMSFDFLGWYKDKSPLNDQVAYKTQHENSCAFHVFFHWGGIDATAERDLNCQLGKCFKNIAKGTTDQRVHRFCLCQLNLSIKIGNRQPLLLSASIMWG